MKTCKLCGKKINLLKDSYCHIKDFKQGVFFLEGFYHTICYNNQLRGLNPAQSKMKRVMMQMLGRANRLMDKVDGGEKPQEIYEVKP